MQGYSNPEVCKQDLIQGHNTFLICHEISVIFSGNKKLGLLFELSLRLVCEPNAVQLPGTPFGDIII